jgi:hypothetical protein
MNPTIIRPFSDGVFSDLAGHVREVRRIFEGTPWHDVGAPDKDRFNRYWFHNLPLLVKLHKELKVDEIFGEPVKPSYVFLSMYGDEGICPLHTDRPQCKYTADLCIDQKEVWPIMVSDEEYLLQPGEALCYSGTDHPHYRNRIQPGNFCNLAFFHFVPVAFEGRLE